MPASPSSATTPKQMGTPDDRSTDQNTKEQAGNGGVIIDGWLTKKASGFPYNWQHRYFVLSPLVGGGFQLRYYAPKAGSSKAESSDKAPNVEVRDMILKGEVCVARYHSGARLLYSPHMLACVLCVA